MESWFAVQVKPNHEKAVARAVRSKGYEDFLPLYRTRRQWWDRVKEVELPLFPGYVFARFDPDRRLPVLTIPGVWSIVSNGRAPLPAEEGELDAIRTIIKSGSIAGPWPFLKVGQRVRVCRGSMKGLEGILIEVKNDWRLVSALTLLQRSVAVEIDRDMLTPIL